ncbi:MAG: AmmeMemoRadiSam system protein A [Lachnospiraceae bacterium]|nr:AmmeMemoRadiSam system protein A [Lachnospiraceae bacterium]
MSVVAAFAVPHPPMIVPQVGRGSEKSIAETISAYKKVAEMISRIAPDTIVLSSPHSVMYADYFHISPGESGLGDFGSFGAAEVKTQVTYDEEFVSALCSEAELSGLSAGTLGERDKRLDHGSMVPLYFILQKYTDFRFVRIGLSGLPMEEHYRMGMAIGQVAKTLGRKTVYIASGDLSHKLKEEGPYGFDPAGPEYDERIMDVLGRGAFDELFRFDEHFLEKAAECGHRSFVMMAGALDRKKVTCSKLSHQDVTGVGYGICSFLVEEQEGLQEERGFLDLWEQQEDARRRENRKSEDCYVRLARKSLEQYILTGSVLTSGEGIEYLKQLAGQPEETTMEKEAILEQAEHLCGEKAGAFVSLHKQGQLRGCIGTIGPVRETLAEEIIENAVSAAVHDSRFLPVEKEELPLLEYSVDVLGQIEPVESTDQLDVKRYGVIVSKGGRRGLLLPNLEGVDSVDTQIAIAKRKGGIGENERDYTLERFEVVRHY